VGAFFFFFETTVSGLISNSVQRIHPETVQLSPFYRKHPKEKRKHAHVPGSFRITISAAVLDLAVAAPIPEDEGAFCCIEFWPAMAHVGWKG
jgi:hypothetical protein